MGHSPVLQMFPEATQILQDLFRPNDLDSWEPHSSDTVPDTKPHGATQPGQKDTPLPRLWLWRGLKQQRALL